MMSESCTKCSENPISPIKVIMYYAASKPVYYQLCDRCIKEKWLKVKIEMKNKVAK
jgi:hypothetical protein